MVDIDSKIEPDKHVENQFPPKVQSAGGRVM